MFSWNGFWFWCNLNKCSLQDVTFVLFSVFRCVGIICAVATDIISVWLNEVLNLLIYGLIKTNYKDKGPFLLIYLNKKNKNKKHVSNTRVCRQISSVKYLLLTVCLRQKLSLEYCKLYFHSYKRPISFNKIAFFI